MSDSPRTSSHPRFRRLLDVADGLHDDPRVGAAQAHLDEGCARCATELDSITHVRDALAAGPLPDPPRGVVRRARSLFAGQRLRSAVGAAARVLATLVLDGRMAAAPALRSGEGGRRLLWTIGAMELFATLADGPSGAVLRAQFLPDGDDVPAPAGEVRVVRDGRVRSSAVLDAEGEFVADGLPGGTYVIEGELDDVAFRTPPFVVGA